MRGNLFANKPTLQQCFDWWDEWEVPENIRQHSTVVARAAYLLAVMLRSSGEDVDPILAHRGGMLHDIDKIQTLELTGAHGALGADFIHKQGFPEVGRMVKGHIMSTILEAHFDERGWENKLVFFCDKLVEGNKLVPFNERLNHLYERYPRYQEMMKKSEASVWALSKEICAILDLGEHEDLIDILRSYS
jgi:putative nucleotidyltransferase with HDIG domain